jgi:hypothetical protein
VFGDVTFAQAPFASLGGNTFAVAQSELAVAGSSFDSPGVARGGRMDEVIAGQDAQVAVTTLRPTQDESAAASSAQSVIANMLANMQEQAATTAAQTVIGTFLASQAESSAATDAQIAVGTFLAAQDETATGADSANRGLLVFVAIAESATGTATQVSQAVFRGTVAEAVSALSTLGVVKEANVYPTGVQLTIRIGGTLVWATIDTGQPTNWTQIPS